MASADMCEHEWPGTGCEGCKAEARERAQQTEQDEADNSYHTHEFAKAQAKPAPAQDELLSGFCQWYRGKNGYAPYHPRGSEGAEAFAAGAEWQRTRPAQTEQRPVAWLCKAEKDSITPHIRFAVTADEAEGFREHYEGRQCIVTITALAPIAQTEQEPWAYGWESRDKTRAQVDRTPHGGTWFPLYRQPVQITRSKGDT